jgi:hypothetical protein
MSKDTEISFISLADLRKELDDKLEKYASMDPHSAAGKIALEGVREAEVIYLNSKQFLDQKANTQ